MVWDLRTRILYESHLSAINWLRHFFTTRTAGNFQNSEQQKRIVQQIHASSCPLISAEQTHGNKVALITKVERDKRIPDVDALITKTVGIGLTIRTADCLPLFVIDRKNKAIGLVHAGAKGTEKRIILQVLHRMNKVFGTVNERCLIFLGPHICPCCYTINLAKENYQQLLSAGVNKKNIFISRYCTACRNDIFFSYRREKDAAGRMLAFLMLTP